jgi:hypothetical protein
MPKDRAFCRQLTPCADGKMRQHHQYTCSFANDRYWVGVFLRNGLDDGVDNYLRAPVFSKARSVPQEQGGSSVPAPEAPQIVVPRRPRCFEDFCPIIPGSIRIASTPYRAKMVLASERYLADAGHSPPADQASASSSVSGSPDPPVCAGSTFW